MQVVEMEMDLLRFWKYEIGTATISTFLRKFLKDSEEDSEVI
jgi:hypothetical protein